MHAVTLSWEFPYPGAQFTVRRAIAAGEWEELATTQEMTFADTTADPSYSYYYQVYATVDGNPSDTDWATGTRLAPLLLIDGGDGDDVFIITEDSVLLGASTLYGDIHPDQIVRIRGNSGNDIVEVVGPCDFVLELYGGEGDDTLLGGNRADVIYGGSGKDVLSGGQGNDTLVGGRGKDAYGGGEGDDLFLSGANFDGVDVFVGGAGHDTVDYSARTIGLNASLDGLANDPDADNVRAGIEVLIGGSGDDTLSGDANNNTLYGGEGDDSLFGGAGDDFLVGQTGSDTLRGGAGHDLLYGSRGWDLLIGGIGRDTLSGGAGMDTLLGGGGGDSILARDGQQDRLEQHLLDVLDRDQTDLLL